MSGGAGIYHEPRLPFGTDHVMVLRELLGRSGWLSLVQVADHALPMVTFPILTRALGIEYYGDFAIITSISSYFALFTIASAYITGPKIVAETQNDSKELNDVVSAIVSFQIITFIIISLCFIPSLVFLSMLSKHPGVSILVFLHLNVVGLAPTWFFLGIERTKILGISQFLVRAVGAAAILFLIRRPSDLITYAAINLAVSLMSILFLFGVMLKSGVRIRYPGHRALRTTALSNAGLMGSEFTLALYSGAGPIIVGALIGSAGAGAFAFVDRILLAARALFAPLYNAAFPVLCRYEANEAGRALKLRRLLLMLLLATALTLGVGLFVLAGHLTQLLGGREFVNSGIYLRIVWPIPLFAVCSSFFGILSLVVFGFTSRFSQVRTLGSLGGVACLYAGTLLFGLKGAFFGVLTTEMFLSAGFIAVLVFQNSFRKSLGVENRAAMAASAPRWG